MVPAVIVAVAILLLPVSEIVTQWVASSWYRKRHPLPVVEVAPAPFDQVPDVGNFLGDEFKDLAREVAAELKRRHKDDEWQEP